MSERLENSQFSWACVKLITELALIHRCSKEEMEIAIAMVSNIANREYPSVVEKDVFYRAE
ncbi:hypothetical protein [Kosakonia sp.]|uniref:hypothetical protein n=1 Tax=Kosakonia sp. TaxID=1916651 RepID=UPI0028A2C682|nr:hypothetical protein [Kosakonia sp.]